MAEAIKIMTPIGRLVQGHPMEDRKTTDNKGQPKIGKNNEPETHHYMALAFPKNADASKDEFLRDVWPVMQQVAVRDWPNGEFKAPLFAWKYLDGDGIDRNGKPYADREGYSGCWILKITSGFAYPVVDSTGARIIVNKDEIKRGYYLRAHIGIKGNAPSQSPGLYLNPEFAQLVAFGKEIISVGGPDVQGVLAKSAPIGALPPGASATPINSNAAMPGLPSAGAAAPIPGMASMIPALPPLPAVVAAFPPEGWAVHPQSPTHFYKGTEVKTEAELRATFQSHPAILTGPR